MVRSGRGWKYFETTHERRSKIIDALMSLHELCRLVSTGSAADSVFFDKYSYSHGFVNPP